MPPKPSADLLRAAGLKVTSARMAALTVAPIVLTEQGYLSPKAMLTAALDRGYILSPTVFYRILPRLVDAGLIDARDFVSPRRTSPLSIKHFAPDSESSRLIKAAGISVTAQRLLALDVIRSARGKSGPMDVGKLYALITADGHQITKRGLYKIWKVFKEAGLLSSDGAPKSKI